MTKQIEPAKELDTKPKARPVKAAPAKKQAEASIYIGPPLQGGRLARYTIFKGGVLPPNVASIAAGHKAISRLIVPVSKMALHEKRLRDSTSAEAALFAEAAKIFSKGGE